MTRLNITLAFEKLTKTLLVSNGSLGRAQDMDLA